MSFVSAVCLDEVAAVSSVLAAGLATGLAAGLAAGLASGFAAGLLAGLVTGVFGGALGASAGGSWANTNAFNTRKIRSANRLCIEASVWKSGNHNQLLTIKPLVAKLASLALLFDIRP